MYDSEKVKEGCSLYIINWNTQTDIFITGVAAKPNFYWVFTLSTDQYLFYLMLQNPEVTYFQAEKASETKLIYFLISAKGLFHSEIFLVI